MQSSRCGHTTAKGRNHIPRLARQTVPDTGQENVEAEMAE